MVQEAWHPGERADGDVTRWILMLVTKPDGLSLNFVVPISICVPWHRRVPAAQGQDKQTLN